MLITCWYKDILRVRSSSGVVVLCDHNEKTMEKGSLNS